MLVISVLVLNYLFLFAAFCSLLPPLKAVLLNLLSVAVSPRVLELVFQGGQGRRLA